MRWQPVVLGIVIVVAAGGAGAIWMQAQRPPPSPPPEPALPEEAVELDEATAGTADTGAHCTADTGIVGEVATAAPTNGPGGHPLEPLDLPACADPTAGRALVIKPAKPVDAVARIVVDAAGEVTTTPILGALCATATAKERCETVVARPPPLDGFVRARGRRSLLVWTAADEVGFVRTPDELLAFLGPIDTADEAALVLDGGVDLAAYQVPCLAAGARSAPEGFVLFARSGMCEDEHEHRVGVRPDGSVTQRFAAPPAQPLECRCGLDTRPPHLEDDFETSRRAEARLAAAGLAANAPEAWEAYLDEFPMGPRSARARHVLASQLVGRLTNERDAFAWDMELATSEGDPTLLWEGRRATVHGAKLANAAARPAEGGGFTLSVDLTNGGETPMKDPALWFDLLAADGSLVDQRLQATEGEVVEAGATKTLTWQIEARGLHPDTSSATAWFAGFE